MGYYEISELYPWLYSIRDPLDVFCYLAVGNDKALLYDTAYGIGDLSDVIGKITSNPVITVLSHGHIDHAQGAYQFDEVYLHENDFELCKTHTSTNFRTDTLKGLSEKGISLPIGFDREAFLEAGTGNLKKLEYGKVFDLGGISLEAVAMRGHTTGSVGLFEREKRVLLVSDAASSHVWMFLEESTTVEEYIETLERIYPLDFNTFFTGHSNVPQSKSEMKKYVKAARGASIEKAVPFDAFLDLNPYVYREDGVEIVVNARTLGSATSHSTHSV